MISANVFPVLWRIIYWGSQLLTWLILPFMQSFAQSAEFTMSGKIRGSLIANAIYYGSYLCIFSILLIYVGVKHTLDGQKLKVIGITASNTWGLFLLVLLLGYGLVEVPRSLWVKSRTALYLKELYFRIAKLHGEKCDAEENLEDILNEVKEVAEKIRYNHPLRYCIDLIVKKVRNFFFFLILFRDVYSCLLEAKYEYDYEYEKNSASITGDRRKKTPYIDRVGGRLKLGL